MCYVAPFYLPSSLETPTYFYMIGGHRHFQRLTQMKDPNFWWDVIIKQQL